MIKIYYVIGSWNRHDNEHSVYAVKAYDAADAITQVKQREMPTVQQYVSQDGASYKLEAPLPAPEPKEVGPWDEARLGAPPNFMLEITLILIGVSDWKERLWQTK